MHYVTMTDRFMSGWGKAEGKTNKLVFVCESRDEAAHIERYARARGDMTYINIRSTKPCYGSRYYTQFKTAADYPAWYGEQS